MTEKQDDFQKKFEEMNSKISDFQKKMDSLFSKVQIGEEATQNDLIPPNTQVSENAVEEEEPELPEGPQKHIIFEFIEEELCMGVLHYLEQNYKGCSIKELSRVFDINREEMTDSVEVLINYGIIYERILPNESLYFINEGGYIRFVQELKHF